MSLDIHFLNVGHGDCTFLDFADHLTMIDINNSKSLPEKDEMGLAAAKGLSLEVFKGYGMRLEAGRQTWEQYYNSLLVDPTDYYREHFDGRPIFRYVQTHPDMDHMSGLHRFFWQEQIALMNFWDTNHSKNVTKEEFVKTARFAEIDWDIYQRLRRGQGPLDTHKVLFNDRWDEGDYWTSDGITVLSPTPELLAECDRVEKYNNSSYVLKVAYAGRTVILPGDAEGPAWQDILAAVGANGLKCDVLKAAHHGRESGYDQEAAEAMRPGVVVCSVGKKPDVDATDEYEALGAKVVSTRFHGTITVRLWHDGEVWVESRKGERIAALPPLKTNT